MSKYKVIGLMSGTSLDGVDIAYCEFSHASHWTFELIYCETIAYDEYWKKLLGELHLSSAEKISEVDFLYGNYLGKIAGEFCRKNNISPDFISSHGHTVFHQPHKGYTKQIGSGAALSAASSCRVVCDFRSLDVALGGQGAPLVPIGDRHLFSDFAFCLNLGGIANISYEEGSDRKAFDICACNLVLNYFSMKKGMSFDRDGLLAEKGSPDVELLNRLNNLSYYSKQFPKSLGREDVEKDLLPLLEASQSSVENILATFCEHIARQVSACLSKSGAKGKMLITGGGAYNKYLVDRISILYRQEIVIPEKKIIEFKEAIIFAFLGVLRVRNEVNCLKSVTGALVDNCGGALYESK